MRTSTEVSVTLSQHAPVAWFQNQKMKSLVLSSSPVRSSPPSAAPSPLLPRHVVLLTTRHPVAPHRRLLLTGARPPSLPPGRARPRRRPTSLSAAWPHQAPPPLGLPHDRPAAPGPTAAWLPPLAVTGRRKLANFREPSARSSRKLAQTHGS
jgi:hypothetical protein